MAFQALNPKEKRQGEKIEEGKRKTKSVRSDSLNSCYFCLNNFISALFIDKICCLSLTTLQSTGVSKMS